MLNEQGEEIEGALPSEEERQAEVQRVEAEFEASLEGLSEEEIAEKRAEKEAGSLPDYEGELERERNRLGLKIDKERQKRIEAQKSSMPREEVEKLINEKVGEVQKQVLHERAELIAERLAKSPAEKELILLHYDHSIVPTGNLQEDMENAYAIANRKKTQSTISELQSSLKSKKTIFGGGADGGQPIEQKPNLKFSQEILEAAKFAGVTPEEFVKKQR